MYKLEGNLFDMYIQIVDDDRNLAVTVQQSNLVLKRGQGKSDKPNPRAHLDGATSTFTTFRLISHTLEKHFRFT